MLDTPRLEPDAPLKDLLATHNWLYLHDYQPPDLLPDARIYLINDSKHDVQRIYAVPIQQKARLDVLTRHLIAMREILHKDHTHDRLSPCDIQISSNGDFAFMQMPFIDVRPLREFDHFKTNDMLYLLADLAALLIWLHGQPSDATLDDEDARTYKHDDVLWRIAADHPPCRASINKLSQLATYAMNARRPLHTRLTFAPSRIHALWQSKSHRLQCGYPPLLINGNPWCDLIRHTLLFHGKLVPWRNALINIYFNMQVPITFFSYLFLEELNLLCHAYETNEDLSISIEILETLAAHHGSNTIIPQWYEQPRFTPDVDPSD